MTQLRLKCWLDENVDIVFSVSNCDWECTFPTQMECEKIPLSQQNSRMDQGGPLAIRLGNILPISLSRLANWTSWVGSERRAKIIGLLERLETHCRNGVEG